ncbi:MAG: hypothetical protein GXO74_16595 [Calditrichaeota bacterium]|nr:hypothetical protein [Calditrichota bacterium]
MKALKVLVVFVLTISMLALFVMGCAKKKEAEKAPETEQMQQAPADTAAQTPAQQAAEEPETQQTPQQTTSK